mmetsp:Transcript_11432/g.12546  ORF Transcript_11432/g.12546 Transcript_11432/m.12546 type:complete len:100 (+) Transcript_11432:491-790(+)
MDLCVLFELQKVLAQQTFINQTLKEQKALLLRSMPQSTPTPMDVDQPSNRSAPVKLNVVQAQPASSSKIRLRVTNSAPRPNPDGDYSDQQFKFSGTNGY